MAKRREHGNCDRKGLRVSSLQPLTYPFSSNGDHTRQTPVHRWRRERQEKAAAATTATGKRQLRNDCHGSCGTQTVNNGHVDRMKVTFILAAISTGNAALTTRALGKQMRLANVQSADRPDRVLAREFSNDFSDFFRIIFSRGAIRMVVGFGFVLLISIMFLLLLLLLFILYYFSNSRYRYRKR